MTPNAAAASRFATDTRTARGFNLAGGSPSAAAQLPRPALATRSFEVAALREDGSLYIGQDKAPALLLFESAFSAFARGTLILTVDGEVAVEDLCLVT